MSVLVAVASKHGSTRQIAEAIADELRTLGHAVDLRDAREATTVEKYDAVVVGSAIYAGNWLSEARQFIENNREKLVKIPVWLFSSGPLGEEDPQPKGDPNGLDELMAMTGAQEHQNFVGKLDKSSLGLGERLIVKAVKAPYGDFRDWEAIRGWAREIATVLESVSTKTDT